MFSILIIWYKKMYFVIYVQKYILIKKNVYNFNYMV